MEDNAIRPDAEEQSTGSSCGSRCNWRLPLLLCLILAGLLIVGKNQSAFEPPKDSAELESWLPKPKPEGETVGLAIDFGNGAQRSFDALPWREGMSVADLMLEAKQFRPGIRYLQKGTGNMSFLTSLEGLPNLGGDGSFWQYEINGNYGQLSFGSQVLAAGDRVLWKFGSKK